MHDCKHPDVSDGTSTTVPDIESLSQRLKSCLQEGDPHPHQDFSKPFHCNLFAFDTSLVLKLLTLRSHACEARTAASHRASV